MSGRLRGTDVVIFGGFILDVRVEVCENVALVTNDQGRTLAGGVTARRQLSGRENKEAGLVGEHGGDGVVCGVLGKIADLCCERVGGKAGVSCEQGRMCVYVYVF